MTLRLCALNFLLSLASATDYFQIAPYLLGMGECESHGFSTKPGSYSVLRAGPSSGEYGYCTWNGCATPDATKWYYDGTKIMNKHYGGFQLFEYSGGTGIQGDDGNDCDSWSGFSYTWGESCPRSFSQHQPRGVHPSPTHPDCGQTTPSATTTTTTTCRSDAALPEIPATAT